jgi:hypothetical protein
MHAGSQLLSSFLELLLCALRKGETDMEEPVDTSSATGTVKLGAISLSGYHALNTCGGMDLQHHAFLASAPGNMSG